MIVFLGQKQGVTLLTRGFSHAAASVEKSPGEAGYFIQFAFDSSELGEDFKVHLTRLAEVLASDVMKNSCVKIIGHTDTVGQATYNVGLSERRANVVSSFLTKKLGTGQSRVFSEGKGEQTPLPDLPGGHPKNRRVEILSRNMELGCG